MSAANNRDKRLLEIIGVGSLKCFVEDMEWTTYCAFYLYFLHVILSFPIDKGFSNIYRD